MSDDGGISRLQRRLMNIPEAVKQAVAPDLLKSGAEISDMMRRVVPVDEGKLRNSIAVTGPGRQTPPYSQPGGSMTVPENAVAITVGNSDVRYGHLVEFGTTKSAAQPFFWPSVRLLRKRATNRIKRGIAKAVRNNWGGS
jgi:HK97 gp10 family phage protein